MSIQYHYKMVDFKIRETAKGAVMTPEPYIRSINASEKEKTEKIFV